MTAGELIEKLKAYDKDTPVVITDDDKCLAIEEGSFSVLSLSGYDAETAGVKPGEASLVLFGEDKKHYP